MNLQDIDKIANLVVGSLSGSPGAGLLGCGAVSSTQSYDPLCERPDIFNCAEGYECGGLADFTCCDAFECLDFYCPGTANFGCGGDIAYFCPEGAGFTCGGPDNFHPTFDYCVIPPA